MLEEDIDLQIPHTNEGLPANFNETLAEWKPRTWDKHNIIDRENDVEGIVIGCGETGKIL